MNRFEREFEYVKLHRYIGGLDRLNIFIDLYTQAHIRTYERHLQTHRKSITRFSVHFLWVFSLVRMQTKKE